MPFKSDKQKKWMFTNKPDMAKKWEKDSGVGVKAPTKEKSPIRKDKKRYAAQGGKPLTNFSKLKVTKGK